MLALSNMKISNTQKKNLPDITKICLAKTFAWCWLVRGTFFIMFIFIFTSRSVKFRVIVVDTDLKPFTGTLNKVVIENPSGSIMRQWHNIELKSGKSNQTYI